VGVVSAFVAGEMLAPYLLAEHARHMGADPAAPEDAAMIAHLAESYRATLRSSLLWSVVAAAAMAAAVGAFVTSRLVGPLAAMRSAAYRIAGGRYEGRLDTSAPGEIGALATSFNTMAAALEESESRRRQLVSDLAHEVRTPLSNLRGYLEGIEDGVFTFDDETARAFTRQLERLERLVDDLDVLSRIDEHALSLRPAVVSAGDLVDATAASFRARFEREGVELTVDAPPAGCEVRGDPARLGQVLENLVDNALRYTPSGGRVEVRAAPSGPCVRFEVLDTGVGVPEPMREAIFRRFVRVDPSRAFQDGRGSGLGLTIAKQLVERHGGLIGVRQREGGGSIFWFTVPSARSEPGTRAQYEP
jgi:two-component system, OmpR family, sensor histidine kinase BaeS